MESLIAGLIALATAALFFYILLSQLQAVPLWIVVLIGGALMVVSVVESVRPGDGGGG